MRRLLLALAALVLLRADMYPDSSNAKLPEARNNLGFAPSFSPVADHKAPIDGTTDASAAMAASLAECGAAGGGVVHFDARVMRIASSITIPPFCELRGGWNPQSRGGTISGPGVDFNTEPRINLDSGATINLFGTIKNLAIFRTGMTAATDIRSALSGVSAFAGTAITVANTKAAQIMDLYIVGFNKCLDMPDEPVGQNYVNSRFVAVRIWCDATNGLHFNEIHDLAIAQDIFVSGYYTQNVVGQVTRNRVMSVANNGAGAIRLTLENPHAFLDNDKVIIDGATGFRAVNNGWTAIVVDSTHIDLKWRDWRIPAAADQWSLFSPTTTGTWLSGGKWITVASTNSLGMGQVVAGTGIVVGSKIAYIDWRQNAIVLDTPTTAAGTAAALSFTNDALNFDPSFGGDPRYVMTYLKANWRDGEGITNKNGEGLDFYHAFVYDHKIAFHIQQGNIHLNGAYCDAGPGIDPTKTCVLLDGNARSFLWNGGWVSSYAIQIFIDHSGPGDVISNVRFTGGNLGQDSGAAIASVKRGSVTFSGSGSNGSAILPLFISTGNTTLEFGLPTDNVNIGNGLGPDVTLVFQDDIAQAHTCMSPSSMVSRLSPRGNGCIGHAIAMAASSMAANTTNYVVPGAQGTSQYICTYNSSGSRIALADLRIGLQTAPGVGQSVTATLVYGNNAGTLNVVSPLSCTVADTLHVCTAGRVIGVPPNDFTINSAVDLPPGVCWAVRLQTSAGAAATGVIPIGLSQY